MHSRFNLVVGLQPRIAFAARHSFPRSPLVSRRLISNSACSHADYPSRSSSLSSGINDRTSHAPSLPREYDAQGHELNPYRNGPSALDKAVHLFFFTEIIRGMCQLTGTQINESFHICLRNVDSA
jgi:NADH dehydrogenase (ubiquinone) Fe-S protein 8